MHHKRIALGVRRVRFSMDGVDNAAIDRKSDREMAEDGWPPPTTLPLSRRRETYRFPPIRRTTIRARSSLRSGRPSCTRRSSSRASASSGDSESDSDGPPLGRLPLLAGPDRLLANSFARLGVI